MDFSVRRGSGQLHPRYLGAEVPCSMGYRSLPGQATVDCMTKTPQYPTGHGLKPLGIHAGAYRRTAHCRKPTPVGGGACAA